MITLLTTSVVTERLHIENKNGKKHVPFKYSIEAQHILLEESNYLLAKDKTITQKRIRLFSPQLMATKKFTLYLSRALATF